MCDKFITVLVVILFFCWSECSNVTTSHRPPHIVFIVADDLGWNDVGYHNRLIPTPEINKLAATGIKFENYYVQPLCTPTRAAILTGRYPCRVGLQHFVILPPQPKGIPDVEVTLAERLRELGYSTHMIGKWHLGAHKWSITPQFRGFDTFYGLLNDRQDYYAHNRLFDTRDDVYYANSTDGYDLRNGTVTDWSASGRYSTHLFANATIDIINQHVVKHKHLNRSEIPPLFLYVAFTAVHEPVQVDPKIAARCVNISTSTSLRKNFCGMVSALDEAVYNIEMALRRARIWNDTYLIFTSDNGGNPAFGGNNMPLRGRKNTLFEGGIKGVAFLHAGGGLRAPPLKAKGTSNYFLLHAVDWFPTLLAMAGEMHADRKDFSIHERIVQISGNINPKNNTNAQPSTSTNAIPSSTVESITVYIPERHQRPLDGVNAWQAIAEDHPFGPRSELLINHDPIDDSAAIRAGKWKLVIYNKMNTSQPLDVRFDYTVDPAVAGNKSVQNATASARNMTIQQYSDPCVSQGGKPTNVKAQKLYLFDIEADPSECYDLSQERPGVVEALKKRLHELSKACVPAQNQPLDPAADPRRHGGIWTPWIRDVPPHTPSDSGRTRWQLLWMLLPVFVGGLALGVIVGLGVRWWRKNLRREQPSRYIPLNILSTAPATATPLETYGGVSQEPRTE